MHCFADPKATKGPVFENPASSSEAVLMGRSQSPLNLVKKHWTMRLRAP